MYVLRSQLTDADNAVPAKLHLRAPDGRVIPFHQVVSIIKVQPNTENPIIRVGSGFVVEVERVQVLGTDVPEEALLLWEVEMEDHCPGKVGT